MLKVGCPTIFPFRPHWWHLQPETSVHLSLLESFSGLLYRGHYQPFNWFPFPIQWPDGIHEMETCMASQYPSSWSQQLLLVEYAHKTLTSSTTGHSCLSHPSLHLQLLQQLDSSQSYPSLLCWPSPIQGSHQMAWLLTQDPFEIQKVNNPVAVRHPSLHVSKVKPVKDSSLVPTAPPPLVGGVHTTHTTRHVLRFHHCRRGLQYLVDLEGYVPEEMSWVPARHIFDPNRLRNSFSANWTKRALRIQEGWHPCNPASPFTRACWPQRGQQGILWGWLTTRSAEGRHGCFRQASFLLLLMKLKLKCRCSRLIKKHLSLMLFFLFWWRSFVL